MCIRDSYYGAAEKYAMLGEKDAAFAALEQASDAGSHVDEIKTDPELDNLRSDPRFADLLDVYKRQGFSRTAGVGARFRIDSKITPDVLPRNGSVPVHISYKTAPNENRSERASSSFPRTCSGDM